MILHGSYSAVVGQKTKNGHWTIGHLNDSNDNLEFVYTTDANYNARKNQSSYRAILRPKDGNLAFTNEIWSVVYPVGSVYLSWNSTSPASLFGGTWTRLSGGFIYGCVDSSGTGNGTGTSTNSHTLTINEIPSHNHGISSANDYNWVDSSGKKVAKTRDDADGVKTTVSTYTGGGKGHSHAIPYIAVFAWRRTA